MRFKTEEEAKKAASKVNKRLGGGWLCTTWEESANERGPRRPYIWLWALEKAPFRLFTSRLSNLYFVVLTLEHQRVYVPGKKTPKAAILAALKEASNNLKKMSEELNRVQRDIWKDTGWPCVS